MSKLRFKIGNAEIEYEGTPSELEGLLQKLLNNAIDLPAQTIDDSPNTTMSEPQTLVKTHGAIDLPLPSKEEVRQYIMRNPVYEHDIFDLQDHFFHRTFKSRGNTKRMYYKFSRLVREIRSEIEEEEEGEFQGTIGAGGVKQFTFKRKKTPVIDMPLEFK